ncbi:MAG: diguanylate cyclase [Sulfurovum sp.]|nr:diguanylate cyclase [Sulfurovum sp.]
MPPHNKKRIRMDAVVILLLFFVLLVLFLFVYFQNLDVKIKKYYDYKNSVVKLYSYNQDYDNTLLRSYAYLKQEEVSQLSRKFDRELDLLQKDELTDTFGEIIGQKLTEIEKQYHKKRKLIEQFIMLNESISHSVYALYSLQKSIESSSYENIQLENLLRDILFKVGEIFLDSKLDTRPFKADLRSLKLHVDLDENIYYFYVQTKSFAGAIRQLREVLVLNDNLNLDQSIEELKTLLDQEYLESQKKESALGHFFFLFTFIILLVLIFMYFNVLRHRRNVYHLAYHDILTNLANRTEFERYSKILISNASNKPLEKFSVFFIDLDGFKVINDTLGHDIGDALLICVSKRIAKIVGEENFTARIGGDEFVVIIEEEEKIQNLKTILEDLLKSIAQPLSIDPHAFRTTASIGVANYPEDGRDKNTLLKHADAAMYAAKQKGKDQYVFYRDIEA